MPIQAPAEDGRVHNRQQNRQQEIRTSKAQSADAGWLPGLPPAPLGVQQWHALPNPKPLVAMDAADLEATMWVAAVTGGSSDV